MKKIIILLLALTMILALAACGAAKEPAFADVCKKVDESVTVGGSLTAPPEDAAAG